MKRHKLRRAILEAAVEQEEAGLLRPIHIDGVEDRRVAREALLMDDEGLLIEDCLIHERMGPVVAQVERVLPAGHAYLRCRWWRVGADWALEHSTQIAVAAIGGLMAAWLDQGARTVVKLKRNGRR